MASFRGSFRTGLIALLLCALPFYLYFKKPESSPAVLKKFDSILIALIGPVVNGIRGVSNSLSHLVHHYLFLVETAERNEALRRQVWNYRQKEADWKGVALENERLAGLLHFQEGLSYSTVAARVLSYPISSEFRVLWIDRGEAEGVARGAPVIAPEGLVGRILRAESHRSQVLLITDPTSAVDGEIIRTGARGLIVGKGEQLGFDHEIFIGAFEYWGQKQVVAEGDEVITSGLDGVFPRGLLIGRAREIRKRSDDLFLKARLVPALEFNQLKEVLVIKKP